MIEVITLHWSWLAFRGDTGCRGNPGDTLFSNIRFNARVLVMPEPVQEASVVDAEVDQILAQTYGSSTTGTAWDAQLGRLEERFVNHLRQVLQVKRPRGQQVKVTGELALLRKKGHDVAELAIANGFTMNPREAHTFAAIHAAVSTGMKHGDPLQRQLTEASRSSRAGG